MKCEYRHNDVIDIVVAHKQVAFLVYQYKYRSRNIGSMCLS